MEYVCQIEGLRKQYRRTGVWANAGIDLSISPGELLGVFGPNGAGKTTMVRQVMGLLKPTSGSIRLMGQDIVAVPDHAPRFAAYHAQQGAILGSHTIFDVLQVAGVLRGVAAREAAKLAWSLLEEFGLASKGTSLMLRSSGGERQLALFLSTFMGNRSLVILDEPTSNLDPSRRSVVWDFLQRKASEGTAILLVTHNVAEADQVVDRVVIVDHGRVIANDTPGELKKRVTTDVEIRLTLKAGASVSALSEYSPMQIREQRWTLRARPDQCAAVLDDVIRIIGTASIDDFSVSGVSLDTVYEALTGKWWDERNERN